MSNKNNFKLYSLLGVVIVLLLILTFAGINSKTAKFDKSQIESSSNFNTYEFLNEYTKNNPEIVSLIQKVKSDSLNSSLIDQLINKSSEQNINHTLAYGYFLKGKNQNNIKLLQQAADLFLEISSSDSILNFQQFCVYYGKKSCDLILEKEPENKNALTKKASFLIYLENETMQGVQLLKEVETLDSNYIEAQHLLMILAIQSNQYEKAVKRLKKLISLQPENSFYKELLLKIETQQLK